MSKIEQALKKKGFYLPQAPTPVGAYRAILQSEKILYVSGQFPFKDGELIYKGKIGKDLTTEEGYSAAELCALNLLSQLVSNLGEIQIKQIMKLDGMINCTEYFYDHAKVLDGATNLLSEVLGEKAGHTRTVIGCNSLPHDAAIEIGTMLAIE